MAHKTLRRFHGYDYSRGGSMFVSIHQNQPPHKVAIDKLTLPAANLPVAPLRGYRFGEVDHDRVVAP